MATTKTIQPTGTTITIPAMTDRPDASVFAMDISRITDAVNAENSKFTNKFQTYNQTVNAGSDFTFTLTTGSHAFCGIAAGFCHLFMTGESSNPTLYFTDVPSGFEITSSGTTVTIHRTNGAAFGIGIIVV